MMRYFEKNCGNQSIEMEIPNFVCDLEPDAFVDWLIQREKIFAYKIWNPDQVAWMEQDCLVMLFIGGLVGTENRVTGV